MVLQCDWAILQIIELTNDGNGFGFGISGSRNSGAVVRNIFPGGAASREGSLRNGDHLLQVGDVRLWGLGAEQVASILRQAGQQSIRVMVARPVDPGTATNIPTNSAIVPTKSLSDPGELDRALANSMNTQVLNLMSAGSTDDRQMAGSREGVGPSLSAGHSTTLVMQKGDNGSGVGQNSAMTASTDSDCKVSRANTMPARRLSKAGNANGAAKGAATGGCSLNPPATNPRQLVSTVTDVHQVESEIEAGEANYRRTDVSEACSSSHGCGGDGSSETAADGDRSSNGTASTQRMEDSTASLCTQTSKHIFSNPFQDKAEDQQIEQSEERKGENVKPSVSSTSFSCKTKVVEQVETQDVCLQAQIPTPQSPTDTPTFPAPEQLASHHHQQQQRRTSSTKRSSNESRQPAQTSKLRRVQSAVNPSDLKSQCTGSRTSQSDYKLKSAACSANQSDYSCTSFDEESDFCQDGTSGRRMKEEEEEREIFEVRLQKDEQGLGLTVAGYICEKASLCGIFVKGVVEGSVADVQGNIKPNDQVIQVNGEELSSYTNQEAVELLKRTGKTVYLKLCRYPGGLKFQQLQGGRGRSEESCSEVYTSSSEMELKESPGHKSVLQDSSFSSQDPVFGYSEDGADSLAGKEFRLGSENDSSRIDISKDDCCLTGCDHSKPGSSRASTCPPGCLHQPGSGRTSTCLGGCDHMPGSRASTCPPGCLHQPGSGRASTCPGGCEHMPGSRASTCTAGCSHQGCGQGVSSASTCQATQCSCRECSCKPVCSTCSSAVLSPDPLTDFQDDTEIIIQHSSLSDVAVLEKCSVIVSKSSRDQGETSLTLLRCPDSPVLQVAPLEFNIEDQDILYADDDEEIVYADADEDDQTFSDQQATPTQPGQISPLRLISTNSLDDQLCTPTYTCDWSRDHQNQSVPGTDKRCELPILKRLDDYEQDDGKYKHRTRNSSGDNFRKDETAYRENEENVHNVKQASIFKAKSDLNLAVTDATSPELKPSVNLSRSKSVEEGRDWIVWSQEILEIQLVKGENGLGFSILDYQDPVNLSDRVIVVRSLVPGGIAQQDGRILAGDRIMYVNSVCLKNSDLETAVQALKGAPCGIVKVGVSKPVSPNSIFSTVSLLEDYTCTVNKSFSTPQAQESESVSDKPDHNQTVDGRQTPECDVPEGSRPQPGASMAASQKSGASRPHGAGVATGTGKPRPAILNIVPESQSLPHCNISSVKVRREPGQSLGMEIDARNGDIGGCLIKTILPQYPVSQSNILKPGDMLISVNGRSLVNITNDEAATILAQSGLDPTFVFIPSSNNVTTPSESSIILSDIQEQEELSVSSGGNGEDRLCLNLSPDLTVKSAATPDFLLENLPETFIDWKEPEATSSIKSPANCGVPFDNYTSTHVVSKDKSNIISPKEEEKSDILTENCQDKSSNNPTTPRDYNSQNKVSCAATPSPSNCTSAPHLDWTAGGHQEEAPTQQENQGETISPTKAEQNQKEGNEGGKCLGEEVKGGKGLPTGFLEEKAASPAREGSPINDFISSVDNLPPTKDSPEKFVLEIEKSPPVERDNTPEIAAAAATTQPENETLTSPSGTPGQVDPEPSNNSHNKSIDNTLTETANTTKEEKTVDDEQIIKTKTSEIAESCKVTATVPTNNNRCIQSTNSKVSRIAEKMQTNQGDLSASRTPKCWGPKRLVEVPREPGQSLGISIVGGKVEMSGGSTVDGIFIKNVIPSSPAGRTGGLSTGDRIVEVDGYPLLSSDQEDAVKAISNAKTPLRLMVQSLIQQKSVDNKGGINKNNNNNHQHSQDDYRKGKAPSKLIIPNIFFNPANGPTNGPTTNGFSSSGASSERGSSRGISSRNGKEFANNNNSKPTSARKSSISPSSPEVRDNYSYSYAKTGDGPLPGNCVVTNLADLKPGDASSMRSDWSRTSSPPPEPELIQSGLTDQEKFIINTKIDFAKRDKERGNRDDDKNEDPVECTIVDDKIVERKPIRSSSIASMKSVDGGMVDEDGDIDMEEEATWSKMDGEIIKAVVEQNEYGLGLSLAGHKDRETMRTFICGIHPRGKAHQLDLFKPGDQLLKVGDSYVGDRCHLNVTSMIKSYSNLSSLEVVVLRPRGQSCVAVKEVTQFPLLLDDMIFESPEFSSFLAKRELRVHKGKQGLGIMIIEGNHKATGNGIFVSDIQEQSAAFHAGLKVGDMILAINTETFLHISYDQAVSVIKGLGGNVKLLVTNPKEEEERKNNAGKAGTDSKLGDAKAGAAAGKSPAKPDPKDKKDVKPVDTKPKEEKKGKVDLKKEKNSFGLGLVGGSDTPLGEILIHEVFPDSPAAKSNVLKPGFRINKINETELKNMTHEAAMEVLRSAQDKVTLHFEKREGGDEVDLFQKIDITLNRKANKGLGISLVGRRDGPGVFVSALVPGSLAETSGLLTQGDQIIKVNDIDLEKANQDTAVAVMKSTTGDIKITVKRLNAISKS